MKVIITDEDAYHLLRDRRNDNVFLHPAPIPSMDEIGCGIRDIERAGIGELATANSPLNVLSPRGHSHTRSDRIRQHVWKGDLPPGSLLATDNEGVLIQAPPFMALTLARRWPSSWLTMLVCEMCGEASTVGDEEHYLEREAVSSLADFEEMLAFAGGRYGAKTFRKVIAAAGNGCASPLEFEARAVLCLPVSDGGFETGEATSNLRVVVSDPDGTRHVRYIDLAWELKDEKGEPIVKGVEVDGGQHNKAAVRTGDHVRSYELRSRGIEELRCNSAILDNLVRMTKFGEGVRHMLGLDKVRMTKAREQARMALCQSIGESPWHRLHLME